MKTTRVKTLLTSMLLLAAVPAMLFSAEEASVENFTFSAEGKFLKKSTVEFEMTPLLYATGQGDLGEIRTLIEGGADVDGLGVAPTPLILALNKDKSEVINLLLDLRANVNIKTPKGITPLEMAVVKNNIGSVKLLLRFC